MKDVEEDFRAFLCGALGANRAAKDLWKQKVASPKAGRAFKNMLRSVQTIIFEDKHYGVLTFNEDKGNEFITNLTRGLIFKFYPHRWSPALYFRVRLMNGPSAHPKAGELFKELAPRMTFFRRGDVFACYHREVLALSWYSIWIYNFFGCAQFFVFCTDRSGPEFLD